MRTDLPTFSLLGLGCKLGFGWERKVLSVQPPCFEPEKDVRGEGERVEDFTLRSGDVDVSVRICHVSSPTPDAGHGVGRALSHMSGPFSLWRVGMV